MPQPQKGICAEPNLHALLLMFNVHEEHDVEVRQKLVEVLNIFEYFDNEHYEAMVSGVIAVGSNYWLELYPGLIPVELSPFPDMSCEDRHAPVVPFDLFIQIRADRADICHAIGMQVLTLLRAHVELVEQTKAFRYLDGRDLTEFAQCIDNPRGMKKFDVAIVGDNDPDFAGGSYIHVQRFSHNLDKWNELSVIEQELIMGISKREGKALAEHMLSPGAHLQRMQVTDSHGSPVNVLQQSMPYGDLQELGMYFIACAASPKPFKQILRSRYFGDAEGHYDKLLDFTTAETGAAFFAPSIEFIKNNGKR